MDRVVDKLRRLDGYKIGELFRVLNIKYIDGAGQFRPLYTQSGINVSLDEILQRTQDETWCLYVPKTVTDTSIPLILIPVQDGKYIPPGKMNDEAIREQFPWMTFGDHVYLSRMKDRYNKTITPAYLLESD